MLRLILAIALLTATSAKGAEIAFVESSPTYDVAVASSASEGSSPDVSLSQASACDDISFCCGPTWFASADALWLQRGSAPLVQALTNTGGIVDQAFPSDQFESGVRL